MSTIRIYSIVVKGLDVPLNLLNYADSITNSMEQIPSGQPSSLLAIWGIPCLLWRPEVHVHVHVHINLLKDQTNPFFILLYLFKIRLYIIISFTLRSFKWPLSSFRLSKNFISCILLRLTYSLQQPVFNWPWYIFTHWSETPNFAPMINCNLVYFMLSQPFVISSCISHSCCHWPFVVNKNISLLVYVGRKHICHFNTKLFL